MARAALVAAVTTSLALFAAQALAGAPEVLEIQEPAADAAPLDPADVHMVAVYADEDDDAHVCSDWRIETALGELVWHADCAEDDAKVHIHLGDGEFVNALEGHSRLDFDSDYVLRVRFKDDGDPEEEWSEWAERSFSTREPGPRGDDTAKPWVPRPGYAVEIFARGFQLPVNIAMVPSPGPHGGDPLMYVTELYGNVKVVTRDGTVKDYATGLLNFDPTGNFPGSGEKGLAGIVVDPASGDLFVSLVYEGEDERHYPKVMRLISDERGLEAVGQEDVIELDSDPQGASHQISNLTIGPEDGALYVHNADGSAEPEKAQDLESFLGKILRMGLDGEPLADNPFYDAEDGIAAKDYVWTYGHRNPFGGAWKLSDATHYMVENGPEDDRLALVERGVNFRWPEDQEMNYRAAYHWNPPHAPVNIEFVEPQRFGGSGFPAEAMGDAFVTLSGSTYASGPVANGKRIDEYDLAHDGHLRSGPTTLVEYRGTGKATAVGLAAGADGLYFTDLYKDQGYETPIDRGANLLRVVYCGGECPDEGSPPLAPAPASAPAALDGVAPVVRGFRLRREVFAVGRGRRAARFAAIGRGTEFRYWLSEPATARIRIEPLGRRGPRGVLGAPGKPGPNRLPFAGFLGGGNRGPTLRAVRRRRLRPGRWLATIVARDAAGNVSQPRRARFRVVAPRRKQARIRRGHGRGT